MVGSYASAGGHQASGLQPGTGNFFYRLPVRQPLVQGSQVTRGQPLGEGVEGRDQVWPPLLDGVDPDDGNNVLSWLQLAIVDQFDQVNAVGTRNPATTARAFATYANRLSVDQ